MKSSAAIVIPARLASRRFPGKLLRSLSGRPILQWVYEACRCAAVGPVYIATPDEEIRRAAAGFSAPVLLTRKTHLTGTDRVAEACERLPHSILLNVQGDEPLIAPQTIRSVYRTLLRFPRAPMATAAAPVSDSKALLDPHTVKVVFTSHGKALYFSRSPIPAQSPLKNGALRAWQHIGIYGYRASFLKIWPRLPRRNLEEAERLEQLRALENGYEIRVARVRSASPSVDTLRDYRRIRARFESLRRRVYA
ncbi:MAG: 3-deoxy-manno-octulosonate cytidylyltransferase [Elusimicrobia bacterium]|nr:3-deoxy-manno-octulosonate cytidylyltransferase [Elusimicrobiota bacterium]